MWRNKNRLKRSLRRSRALAKILIAGCNECVTVCESGGKKEVAVLASALRMYFMNQGKEVKIDEVTLERQCDHEYLEEIRKVIDQYDAVLSLACGVGVQFLAEKYMRTPVLPGVDTCFMGVTEERGVWTRTLPGLRPVHSCQNRRHLSCVPMRQEDLQRTLRRVHQREVRNRQGARLCLAVDYRSSQGTGQARRL